MRQQRNQLSDATLGRLFVVAIPLGAAWLAVEALGWTWPALLVAAGLGAAGVLLLFNMERLGRWLG